MHISLPRDYAPNVPLFSRTITKTGNQTHRAHELPRNYIEGARIIIRKRELPIKMKWIYIYIMNARGKEGIEGCPIDIQLFDVKIPRKKR